jgi:hypothetical protein
MPTRDLHQHLNKVFDQREREAGSGVNVFVIVEMADYRRMSASLGLQTAEMLIGAFQQRVRGFLRACDQQIMISDERCGAILTQIQSMEQLDLAAAKLFRHFESPIEIVDQTFKVTVFATFVVPTKARTDAAQLLDEGERGLPVGGRRGSFDSLEVPDTGPDLARNVHALHSEQFHTQAGHLVLHSLGRSGVSRLAGRRIGGYQRRHRRHGRH